MAGSFPYAAGGTLRVNNLAWWDGIAWSNEGLDNGNGDTTTTGNFTPVLSTAVRSDTIFVGNLGNHWHYDPALEHAAMLVDGLWVPCGSPNSIFYFLESNGRMFSGGVYDSLYGSYAPGIREWIDGSFQPIPNMPFTSIAQVNDVAFWHDQYYFGGVFQILGSRKMVAFDGLDQWTPLAGGVGGNFVQAVCGYGDSLYVGGFMLPGPDVQSQHIQIWDGAAWLPFFDEVYVSGKISDIQEYEGSLYISGGFMFGSDTTQYGLIRYDGHQICALGGYMFNGGFKMAFFNDALYMALEAQNADLPNEFIGYLDLDSVVPDTCVMISPTSVSEIHPRGTLQIFPNPANDQITFTSDEPVQVVILDALARRVWEGRVVGRTTIDASSWDAGSYTVRHEAGAIKLLVTH